MLIPVIVISILTAFSIWCGIKLFLMGSGLAELISRYGIILAIAFGLVSSLVLILPAMLEYLERGQVAVVSIIALAAFCLGGFLLSLARRLLLTPRKVKGRDKPKVSLPAFVGIDAIDFLSALLTGGLMGIALVTEYGAALIGLCAFAIFAILERSKNINRYEAAVVSGAAIKVNTIGSIVLVAAGMIASALVMHQFYAFASIAVAATLAFLVYLSGCGLVAFVKSLKK